MILQATIGGFLYSLLSTMVLVRLGRRPGASGMEEKILIWLGWILAGLSFGAAGLLAMIALIRIT